MYFCNHFCLYMILTGFLPKHIIRLGMLFVFLKCYISHLPPKIHSRLLFTAIKCTLALSLYSQLESFGTCFSKPLKSQNIKYKWIHLFPLSQGGKISGGFRNCAIILKRQIQRKGKTGNKIRVLNIQDDVSAFDQGFSLLWSCTVLYSEG